MGSKEHHLCLALNVVMLTSRQRTAPMTNPPPSPHPSTGHCWVHHSTLTYQGRSVFPSPPYTGKSLRLFASRGQRLILPCAAAKDGRTSTPNNTIKVTIEDRRMAVQAAGKPLSCCYRRHLVYASYSNFPSQISLVVVFALFYEFNSSQHQVLPQRLQRPGQSIL